MYIYFFQFLCILENHDIQNQNLIHHFNRVVCSAKFISVEDSGLTKFFVLQKTGSEIPSRQESRQPWSSRKVQRNQQCQLNPHRWDQTQDLRWIWLHGALRVRAVWRRECQILLSHVEMVVQGESSFPYKQLFYASVNKGSVTDCLYCKLSVLT